VNKSDEMPFRIGAFLLAESVSPDERGRVVVSGILDVVETNTVRTASVYAEFFVTEGPDQRINVTVRIVGPDGATSEFAHDQPVTLRSGMPSTSIVLRGRVETRKRGVHEVQLVVDGTVLADRPLLATEP